MSVTINAKGTSTSSFKVGKNGTTVTQGGVISPPAATDLIIDIDQDQSLVIGVGNTGPALITATANQDLHINPAVGGGQYLILNSSRWPTTSGTTGQALTTNGSGILSWTTIAGSGTVSSVAITPSDGIGVTGSPITTSGTFSLSLGDITPDSVAAVGTVSGSNLSGSHAGTSSGSNTGDQTITLTGDVTGSGTGSFAATLTTIGTAVSDSFVKITTDAKGRTYATSAVTSGDITTALGYTPVNKAGDTMTGQLVLNANPGTSLAAATKQYVDAEIAAVASGINVHAACETATSAALATSTYNNGTGGLGATLTCDTNSALGTIGGYAGLNTTSRLLVKNQAATLQNGIYTVTSLGVDGVLPWILTRATDFDGSPTSEVQAGDMTFVQEGTFAGTQWVQIAVGTGSPGDYIIVGTNPIVFSQFAGAGTYTAGTGINITDAVISNTGVTSAVAGANISVSAATGAVTFAVTGTVPTATTATTLATGRTFSLSTDATGTSGSFDGSGNVTIPMTLATVNPSPQTDTFRKVTVNAKGLVTATSAVTTSDITALVDSTYVNVSGDTMTGVLQIGTNMAGYGNLNVARNVSSPYATITAGDETTPTNTIGIYLRQTSGQAGISTGGSGLSFYRGGPGATETMSLGPNGNVVINAPASADALSVDGLVRATATSVPTFSLGTLNVSTWNVGMLSQNTTPLDASGKVTVGAIFAPRGTINTAASFGNILGSYSFGTVDSTVAGSTGAVYGTYGNAQRSNAADASTGWNAIYGAFGGASQSNTLPATASSAIIAGVYGNASLGGGTVTNTLSSFYGTTSLNTGASVLNISVPSVSFYDGSLTLGGTSTGTTAITNLYGLRLRSPTIQNNVTITNRYGVSSEDASATNYFAGNVGVGIVPTTILHLSAATPIQTFQVGTANSFAGAQWKSGGSTTSSILHNPNSGELKIAAGFSTYGGFQTFYTDGSERMRILTTGPVVVNSTTNAGIGGGADIFAVGGNIGFNTQLNASPGSGNFLEIVNRSAGGIKLYTDSGSVVALAITTAGNFEAGVDNTQTMGAAAKRWSVVYAGTGTINTSDENEKEQITALSIAELNVAIALKGMIKKFKYKDAVALKGSAARWHVGVIAQEVRSTFIAHGLDATEYGIFCEDSWWELNGEVVVEGTENAVMKTRLGVRYDEFMAFIIASL